MARRNEMDDLHNKIVRKFHTLCSLNGMTDDEKRATLAPYGVESSALMETHDLIDVCGSLQKQLDARTASGQSMDGLRKQCLRAICDYMAVKKIKAENKISYAKQIACRASGRDNFNRMTAAELRGVIGYFNRERKAIEGAGAVVETLAPAGSRAMVYYPFLISGEAN